MSRYVDEHGGRFGVEPICRVLDVSVSAYYQRRSGRRSARAVEDERLLGRIRELHAANYDAYGYRRMWKTLLRAGEQVPPCRVQRLMRAHTIQGAKRRGKRWRTTRPDPSAGRRPDLVQRDFSTRRPNELWVADLCYLRCWEGLVFYAFVIDAYSRKVVGWQLATHMRTDLVLDALKMALAQRAGAAEVALVHHSDRGSQYTSFDYTQTLDDHGLLASVGSVGDACDNALAVRSGGPERASWRWQASSPEAFPTRRSPPACISPCTRSRAMFVTSSPRSGSRTGRSSRPGPATTFSSDSVVALMPLLRRARSVESARMPGGKRHQEGAAMAICQIVENPIQSEEQADHPNE